MKHSFKTKIVFHHLLSKEEQFDFWTNAIKSMREMSLTGPVHFKNNMEWNVDYTDSMLNEYEAKTRFSKFLERQKAIIKDYSFYTPTAA